MKPKCGATEKVAAYGSCVPRVFKRNYEKTTVYLEKNQMKSLREVQQGSGIPIAAYIRRGVDLALAEVLGDD